ncbi:50S ribosomal protein L4 [Fundidesulfovibrio magnetotacticus]|uniref:Large ribosomal subunit protein uL4 n=1 Tax=Fundidesulfovibrio magnetotacticus TaxID=2730080 RepID=A0A6V8LYG5_9BACT|nr:50S ribosomal protein L4 [Fundidesulfovibrio magnetotacticus]GFK95631.1 50S ribosomal protein L4 [Fundidesulfovibrio magnetotacticus]
MATVKVFDQTNKEVGQLELAPEVFEVAVRPELLHLVVRSQLAAKRAGTHSVKTRSFVSGSGSKPWRQKGTGRARSGAKRSPIWKGGAVVHGPQPRSYEFKVNKKIKALALKMALSTKVAEESLILVDKLDLPEVKTKLFAGVAGAFGLKKALIVLPESNNTIELSARNLPGIKVVRQDMLNVYDLLKHPQLVMVQGAAQAVQERLR